MHAHEQAVVVTANTGSPTRTEICRCGATREVANGQPGEWSNFRIATTRQIVMERYVARELAFTLSQRLAELEEAHGIEAPAVVSLRLHFAANSHEPQSAVNVSAEVVPVLQAVIDASVARLSPRGNEAAAHHATVMLDGIDRVRASLNAAFPQSAA